jgi:hypothetical protein
MKIQRPLKFAFLTMFLVFLSPKAFATAVTSGDIAISGLSITADTSYVLDFFPSSSLTSAKAGPDNLLNVQTSNTSPADATIGNATGHADVSGSTAFNNATNPAGTTITNGTLHATSSVNLPGTNNNSQSVGSGDAFFEFEAIGTTSPGNTTNVTFAMTFSGSLSGSADAFGNYASEVKVDFGYYDNQSGIFIPLDFFDEPLTGGPSDNKNSPIGSQTLTQTVALNIGQDYFFQADAKATSSAANAATIASVPEPASLALFGTALLGLGFLRRRKRIA